jgi:hypothetical protein
MSSRTAPAKRPVITVHNSDYSKGYHCVTPLSVTWTGDNCDNHASTTVDLHVCMYNNSLVPEDKVLVAIGLEAVKARGIRKVKLHDSLDRDADITAILTLLEKIDRRAEAVAFGDTVHVKRPEPPQQFPYIKHVYAPAYDARLLELFPEATFRLFAPWGTSREARYAPLPAPPPGRYSFAMCCVTELLNHPAIRDPFGSLAPIREWLAPTSIFVWNTVTRSGATDADCERLLSLIPPYADLQLSLDRDCVDSELVAARATRLCLYWRHWIKTLSDEVAVLRDPAKTALLTHVRFLDCVIGVNSFAEKDEERLALLSKTDTVQTACGGQLHSKTWGCSIEWVDQPATPTQLKNAADILVTILSQLPGATHYL